MVRMFQRNSGKMKSSITKNVVSMHSNFFHFAGHSQGSGARHHHGRYPEGCEGEQSKNIERETFIVEPLNKGHIGIMSIVPCREGLSYLESYEHFS